MKKNNMAGKSEDTGGLGLGLGPGLMNIQGPNPLYISKNDLSPKFIKSCSGGGEHTI